MGLVGVVPGHDWAGVYRLEDGELALDEYVRERTERARGQARGAEKRYGYGSSQREWLIPSEWIETHWGRVRRLASLDALDPLFKAPPGYLFVGVEVVGP